MRIWVAESRRQSHFLMWRTILQQSRNKATYDIKNAKTSDNPVTDWLHLLNPKNYQHQFIHQKIASDICELQGGQEFAFTPWNIEMTILTLIYVKQAIKTSIFKSPFSRLDTGCILIYMI